MSKTCHVTLLTAKEKLILAELIENRELSSGTGSW